MSRPHSTSQTRLPVCHHASPSNLVASPSPELFCVLARLIFLRLLASLGMGPPTEASQRPSMKLAISCWMSLCHNHTIVSRRSRSYLMHNSTNTVTARFSPRGVQANASDHFMLASLFNKLDSRSSGNVGRRIGHDGSNVGPLGQTCAGLMQLIEESQAPSSRCR